MSLVGTLAKVAIGIAVSKGIGAMVNRGGAQGGGQAGSTGGGLGGLLGGLMGGNPQAGGNSTGSLSDLLGGNTQQAGGQMGGLGGLLDSLGGGATAGGLGGMLNQAINGGDINPSNDQEDQARVMIQAMVAAMMSDGQIDDAEKEKLIEHLGDVTQDEADFVREQMDRPVSVDQLVASVPKGMEQQVYLTSLMAIDLDAMEEAKYLDQLAQGLGISHQASDSIHEQLGAPKLYS